MRPAAFVFLMAVSGCTAGPPSSCDPLPVPPVPPASVVRRPVKPPAPVADIRRAAIEYATRPDATAEGIAAYRAILKNR